MVVSGDRAVGATRRRELGEFLKSRRARIRPSEVGLPVGPRRRTPGLRREEVAQLAGVGVTWYTWLEQGRRINVSVQVLDAVARTLSLDSTERAHLYRLADVPGVPAVPAEAAMPDDVQVILDQLGPLPSALVSARFDVLAHNDAYAALCPTLVAGDRNVIRAAFLTPQCCNPYPGQPEQLARMVGFLRAAYVGYLGDADWIRFVEELSCASPHFAQLWKRGDVARPVGRMRTIRNLAVGDLDMSMTSLSLPTVPGAWFQVWVPVGVAERERLDRLLAMAPEQRARAYRDHAERAHPSDARYAVD
ncbi:transcriptional regulator [Nocardia sp. MDA0666]|uniref:helix-turn-helix transcriptional regulator n=1 Tax=Nocardia sp. MDA0666 TaxID=2135448 RepID=UPI000D11A233|nr:helix-turn-helix transcriptional regulator [Nocardia sp. MDA0666]PSR68565.1 transcriptional regulator [Nocardia sp. MDA0666]